MNKVSAVMHSPPTLCIQQATEKIRSWFDENQKLEATKRQRPHKCSWLAEAVKIYDKLDSIVGRPEGDKVCTIDGKIASKMKTRRSNNIREIVQILRGEVAPAEIDPKGDLVETYGAETYIKFYEIVVTLAYGTFGTTKTTDLIHKNKAKKLRDALFSACNIDADQFSAEEANAIIASAMDSAKTMSDKILAGNESFEAAEALEPWKTLHPMYGKGNPLPDNVVGQRDASFVMQANIVIDKNKSKPIMATQ